MRLGIKPPWRFGLQNLGTSPILRSSRPSILPSLSLIRSSKSSSSAASGRAPEVARHVSKPEPERPYQSQPSSAPKARTVKEYGQPPLQESSSYPSLEPHLFALVTPNTPYPNPHSERYIRDRHLRSVY